MKLLTSSHSPFGRKAVVVLHELGLENVLIEHHETSPTNPNVAVSEHNPLGKVPVLLTENHGAVYDSAVICDYLCRIADDHDLLPADIGLRTRALRQQALASGMCDAGIAIRWETYRRPEPLRYPKLRDGQITKLAASYAALEQDIPAMDEVSVGTIALACALDWLTFRDLDSYAPAHPRLKDWLAAFSSRVSMQASQYKGATHD